MAANSRTRNRIIDLLKTSGAMEAGVLAKELNLTAMAVRQHLYQLQEEKLLSYREEPRAVGRPAKLWQLTEEANRFFPDAHATLAVDLVTSVKSAFGNEGLDMLVEIRAKEQIEQYKERISTDIPLRVKLDILSKIRTEEGYMAEVLEGENDGFLFVENHCPICSAAAACAGLCAAELDVFQKVMGKDTVVKRTEHLLDGARRCAYSVDKADS